VNITIKLTEKQGDFLYAIMNNIVDCCDDESVRRDARLLCAKVTSAIALADQIAEERNRVYRNR